MLGAVAVVRVAALERPIGGEHYGQVVVCVVAPPHAHSCGAVQAQELSGPIQCFTSADGFGVFPPLRAPCHSALHVELAAVGGGQLVADELGDVRIALLGWVRVVLSRPRGVSCGVFQLVVPLPRPSLIRGGSRRVPHQVSEPGHG